VSYTVYIEISKMNF